MPIWNELIIESHQNSEWWIKKIYEIRQNNYLVSVREQIEMHEIGIHELRIKHTENIFKINEKKK